MKDSTTAVQRSFKLCDSPQSDPPQYNTRDMIGLAGIGLVLQEVCPITVTVTVDGCIFLQEGLN